MLDKETLLKRLQEVEIDLNRVNGEFQNKSAELNTLLGVRGELIRLIQSPEMQEVEVYLSDDKCEEDECEKKLITE